MHSLHIEVPDGPLLEKIEVIRVLFWTMLHNAVNRPVLCSFKTFAKFSNFQILKLPNLLAIFLVFSQRFFKGAIMSEC